jgi:SAM-dependent methyltransferase
MITPYSKVTTIDMWTDPYISKQMLHYHLSFQNDIASRRYQTIEKTVDFISSYIGPNTSICDFGCGPGLYTNLLQQKGHRVYGVDISSNSLNYARNQNPNVTYKQLNYITDSLGESVDHAMMIWCDFGAMTPKGRSSFLQNLKQTLKPGGYFFFDVFSVNHFNQLVESLSHRTETDGFFMEGDVNITSKLVKYPSMNLSLSYDEAVGYKTIELYNWDKHYTVEEMKILLNDNGFDIVEYYSDTMGNKDFTDNELLFFVCKKQEESK